MKLDNHIKGLIAVGAAVSANCQPCLQTTTALALETGADTQEIAEAIEVGKRVRKGANSKMDQFTADLAQTTATTSGGGCGCHTADS